MTQDKGVLVPVYLRKKGEVDVKQLRQKFVQRQDPGLAIVAGGPYYRREYITVGGLNDLNEYLSAFGIPSNVVIGDGFNDTTPHIIADAIIEYLKSNEIDPTPIRLKLECFEIATRADIKAKFDAFVSEYKESK